MSQHALLSASGSKKWLLCPGSIQMERGFPNTRSDAATYGSQAHHLAEVCLKNDTNTSIFLNKTLQADDLDSFVVDVEMVDGVQSYLDYVRNTKNIGQMHIEIRVDYSPWVPDGFGTSDCIIQHSGDDEGLVSIIDLKFGIVRVDADNNTQAMLYALGVLNQYGGERFNLCIVQPRIDHISEWHITKKDLLEWATTVAAPQAKLALSENPPINPSDAACEYCKAKGICKTLAVFELKAAHKEFESVIYPGSIREANTLSNDEIASIVPLLKIMEKWAEAIEEHAINELDQGRDIPGYKLIESSKHLIWVDEKKAGKALLKAGLKKKDIYSIALIKPTKAKKLLPKQPKLFGKHVVKPKGNLKLVPLTNKQEAINSSLEDDFEFLFD